MPPQFCFKASVIVMLTSAVVLAEAASGQEASEAAATLAEVKVERFEAIPIGQGSPWKEIPEFLKDAQVFEKTAEKVDNQLRYEVLEGGLMLLAVSWNYDGNSGGGWKTTAWTEAKFLSQGWEPIGKVVRINRGDVKDSHFIYRKLVKAGEKVQLHNRKYNAPVVIAPAAGQAAAIAALKVIPSAQQQKIDDKTPLSQLASRSPTGAPLIGLRVTLEIVNQERRIGAIQPIYAGEREPFIGRMLGSPIGNTVEARAKPGYVVSGASVSSDTRVRGLRLTFARLTETGGIDRADAYESRWIGDQLGDTQKTAAAGGDSAAIGLQADFQPHLRKLELIFGE